MFINIFTGIPQRVRVVNTRPLKAILSIKTKKSSKSHRQNGTKCIKVTYLRCEKDKFALILVHFFLDIECPC